MKGLEMEQKKEFLREILLQIMENIYGDFSNGN